MFLILIKVCFLCIFVHSKAKSNLYPRCDQSIHIRDNDALSSHPGIKRRRGPGDECELDDGVKGSCATFKECNPLMASSEEK
ncbi:hypothetical protein Avbf_13934 [Armadillidium vulgare]|nr:hypothetical protein Avbf_13934 [Armadillidium vulgare]